MMPLVPGDIISTGTPAGVGMGRTPQRWLRPGDDVVVKISGIGSFAETRSSPNREGTAGSGLFILPVLASRHRRSGIFARDDSPWSGSSL